MCPTGSAQQLDSIYTAFAYSRSKHGALLVIPLVVVAALQLALLVFVAVSWTEAMNITESWAFAILPALGTPCGNTDNQEDGWTRLVMALTNIGALCALALYTHAEVQNAVDLFEELQAQLQAKPSQVESVDDQTHPQCSGWYLVVPLLQLMVAGFTLFIQGLIFQSYKVPLVAGEARYPRVMDAVYASVALAFICDLDNRAWVFVKPLFQAADRGNGSQSGRDTGGSSLMLLVAQWWSGCVYGSCTCTTLKCKTCMACIGGCCKSLIVGLFHVMLFVYECTFGMLLTLYATDLQRYTCRGQLALGIVLGCSCFVAFQVMAGVTSQPISHSGGSRCSSGCRHKPWLRPVVLNLVAPLLLGVVLRGVLYTNVDQAVAQSAWRCYAGGVIGCNPCNTTTEWCTATEGCIEACKGGNNSVVSCSDSWCNDPTCVDCLLHHNGSVPLLDVSTDIRRPNDLPVCGGMSSFFWCMHVWMTFIPLALMVLLAVSFLLFEAICPAAADGKNGSSAAIDRQRGYAKKVWMAKKDIPMPSARKSASDAV